MSTNQVSNKVFPFVCIVGQEEIGVIKNLTKVGFYYLEFLF